MSDANIRILAKSVTTLGDNLQLYAGKTEVLEAAVIALLRTHPDHAAFAAEFRRSWLNSGSPHSNPETSAQASAGMAELLGRLEEACRVPLGVRPGR